MNIIRQDASGMRIYRSEKPFPERIPAYDPLGDEIDFNEYDKLEWFYRAESMPVHPDEVEKFIDYTLRLVPYLKVPAECWAEGIPIPDDCFEVRLAGSKDDLIGTQYAYFKEPAKETRYD